MEKEMTIRTLFERLDKGDYDYSRKSMIEIGWYDWFCKDIQLLDRLIKLIPTLRKVCESNKIDIDKNYVFFKNNCPMSGPTYDSFSICDMENGNVLFWFGKLNRGCYGENFSGWEMMDVTTNNTIRGLKEIKKYLELS